MSLIWIVALMLTQITEVQTDWVSGPGVLGPVPSWGSAFNESGSVTFNIAGQISPIAVPGGVDYNAWVKHIIDQDWNITGTSSINPADFDGDGDLDLAGWIDGSGVVRIYHNQLVETGVVNFVAQTDLPGVGGPLWFCAMWCGDLDGDGDPDIVVPGNTGLWWFENLGGFNFTLHQISPQAYWCSSCYAGDIDNDGDMDIIAGAFPLDLWRNGGSQNFTQENIAAWGATWRTTLGDLNGDNYLDLLNAGNVYLNNLGSFSGPPDWIAPLGGVDAQQIRDFDNDGISDLLLGHEYDPAEEIRWYKNDGSGVNYTPHLISTEGKIFGDAAEATDMDLDGKADVCGTREKVGFFQQIGPDNFVKHIVDDNFPNSHWITVRNLDGLIGICSTDVDIDEDIVGTSWGDWYTIPGEFAWWENQMVSGFVTNAFLISSILDAGGPGTWLEFGWEVCRPRGTNLDFFIRAAEDTSQIQTKPWKGPIEVPIGECRDSVDISSMTVAGDRYFQYKVEMGGGTYAPVVYKVWVDFLVEERKDAGPIEIVIPEICLVPGVPINPCCIVRNFGTVTVTIPVYCYISEEGGREVYSDENEVTVTYNEEEWVCFGEFIPDIPDTSGKPYPYAVQFVTVLPDDYNPGNNEITGYFPLCPPDSIHDLATICIFYPDTLCPEDSLYPDSIPCWVPANTNIKPQARYKNVGDFPEGTYFLCAAIDSQNTIVYADSIDQNPFGELQPNDAADVITQFKEWYTGGPTKEPIYTLIYFTLLLPEDDYHKNDTLRIPFGVDTTRGVQEPPAISKTFSLEVKGPSPFAHTAAISYSLPRTSRVCLKVYDGAGKEVNTLINSNQSAGSYLLSWKGNDKNGKRVASGVYFVRMETEDYKATKKLVLVTQ